MVNGLMEFRLLANLAQGWAVRYLFLNEPINIRLEIVSTEASRKLGNYENLKLLL